MPAHRPIVVFALALVAVLVGIGSAACSSDSAVTVASASSASASSASGSTPRPGLADGAHLVVPGPSPSEGFARLVAVAVDDSGRPVVAYSSTTPDDQARPVVRAVTYDLATDSFSTPVLVGELVPAAGGVLRLTSGAGASLSITYETGTATDAPASTTFASNDGGLTWTTATPLSAGTGDPTTAVAPDGRTVHVRVARDGTAPGIYVDVSG